MPEGSSIDRIPVPPQRHSVRILDMPRRAVLGLQRELPVREGDMGLRDVESVRWRCGVKHLGGSLVVGLLLLSCGGSGGQVGSTTEAGADGGGAETGGHPGDSGSSSEGGNCMPLPGCSSGTSCPSSDGCNTCTCEPGGAWKCTGYVCDAGNSSSCPQAAPSAAGPCNSKGLQCSYPLAPGGSCSSWDCLCLGAEWDCTEQDCDAGSSSQYSCPPNQPPSGTSCNVNGAACQYGPCESFGGLGINCLCFQGAWQCAALPGCDAGP